MKDQLKKMESVDLVEMSSKLYRFIEKSYSPYKGRKFNKETSKYANTLIMAFNALRGSYNVKLKHFHLVNIQDKIETVKQSKKSV